MTSLDLDAIRTRDKAPLLGQSLTRSLDQAVLDRRALLAEVDRLAKEQSRWLRAYDAEWDKNFNLNAEVERLRAGIKAIADLAPDEFVAAEVRALLTPGGEG